MPGWIPGEPNLLLFFLFFKETSSGMPLFRVLTLSVSARRWHGRVQKPGLITGLSLTEHKASAGKVARERKRAEGDMQGKIELRHTPFQGGRKEEKVQRQSGKGQVMVLKALGVPGRSRLLGWLSSASHAFASFICFSPCFTPSAFLV